MLGDMSIEDIEQRLDMMIAEREALPESDSTLNSAQESVEKTVDNFEKSVEVDYAKSIGAFNDIDDSSPITA